MSGCSWPVAGVRERQKFGGQRERQVLGKRIGSVETRSRPKPELRPRDGSTRKRTLDSAIQPSR